MRIIAVFRQGERHDVFVDDDVFERLGDYRWCIQKNGYVARNIKGSPGAKVYLHREIFDLQPDNPLVVDHRNHDKLDNQRTNLKVCTRLENNENKCAITKGGTSRHRGVSWSSGKWRAQFQYRGTKWDRRFATESEAVAWVTALRAEVYGG